MAINLNLDQMSKFLEKVNLPKLTLEKTEKSIGTNQQEN